MKNWEFFCQISLFTLSFFFQRLQSLPSRHFHFYVYFFISLLYEISLKYFFFMSLSMSAISSLKSFVFKFCLRFIIFFFFAEKIPH